jgi:hypothetical protein
VAIQGYTCTVGVLLRTRTRIELHTLTGLTSVSGVHIAAAQLRRWWRRGCICVDGDPPDCLAPWHTSLEVCPASPETGSQPARLRAKELGGAAAAIARFVGHDGDQRWQVGESVGKVKIEHGKGQRLKITGHTSISKSIRQYTKF